MLFCCPVPLLQLLIIDKSSVISIYAGTNSVIRLLMSSFEQCYLFFRYGSLYAASLLKKLREDGVYMRPLGNVIYLMCGPCSSPEVCSQLLLKLYQRLEEFDKVEEKLKSCQVVMVLYCNNVWKPLVYSFLNVNLILYVLQIFASSVSLYPILESWHFMVFSSDFLWIETTLPYSEPRVRSICSFGTMHVCFLGNNLSL